jgi:hypothetical protein
VTYYNGINKDKKSSIYDLIDKQTAVVELSPQMQTRAEERLRILLSLSKICLTASFRMVEDFGGREIKPFPSGKLLDS